MKANRTASHLLNVCWLLTSKCNHNCGFCFKVTTNRDITFNEARKILKDLVANKVSKISFSGGEPLLWPGDTIKLIKLAKSLGVLTMIITNGSLLTEKRLKNLQGNLDWITLPLDGSNEKNQIKAGRPTGHFSCVIKLLDLLKNSQFRIKINTVLNKQNIDDIEHIARLIKKYNVKRWKVFQFFPIRDTSLINKDQYKISEILFQNIKKKIEPLFKKNECLVCFGSNKDLEASYFTINPSGIVYVTKNNKDYSIGDLKTQKVKEVWENTELIDKRKYWRRATWFRE